MTDPDAFTGQWRRDGLIMRPVAAPPPPPPSCSDCGGPISRPESLRCANCHRQHLAANARSCADCGARVRDRRATRCRPCATAAGSLGRPPARKWEWDATALRTARRLHDKGHRDEWTVEGNREYNRRLKAESRTRKEVA